MNPRIAAVLGLLCLAAVAGRPYLPLTGPAPLRFQDPPLPRVVHSAPAPLPDLTLPDTDGFRAALELATTNFPAEVVTTITPADEPKCDEEPVSSPARRVTTEMMVDLFRHLSKRPVVGVDPGLPPSTFVPPPPQAPHSSTATYRSQ